MKKYKVLIIKLLLNNKKYAKFGDEVSENQLTDTADNLMRQKWIEPVVAAAPTSAELQAQADAAKENEIAAAQGVVTAAQAAVDNAQKVADENKAANADVVTQQAADDAVAKANTDLESAQAALTALQGGNSVLNKAKGK